MLAGRRAPASQTCGASKRVSNVDGFTLVEGEAAADVQGRPMLRVGAFRRRRRRAETWAVGWPPLDTIANLARTCSDGPPKATRTPRARANVRRTLTAGAGFAVPPVRMERKRRGGLIGIRGARMVKNHLKTRGAQSGVT